MIPASAVPSHERLLNRNFFLLWQGVFVSQAGNQALLVVLILWLKQLTGSATFVALLMATLTLPRVLLGPLGGVVADRFSRRDILVVCDVGRGLVLAVLAGATVLLGASSSWFLPSLFATVFLLGSFSTAFSPAMAALVPDLVPVRRIGAANSCLQGSVHASGLLAQALGGILFRVVAVPLVLVGAAGTFLASAASERLIRPAGSQEGESTLAGVGWWHRLVQGLEHGWRRPGLRLILAAAATLSFFTAPFPVLLPFYVDWHLGASPEWFGFLLAAFSAGALLGYVAAGTVQSAGRRRALALCLSLVAVGVALASLAVVQSPAAACGVLVVAGALNGFLVVEIVTLLQSAVERHLRGRVLALLRMVQEGVAPLAMAVAGWAADLVGQEVSVIFGFSGAALVLLSLGLSVRPQLWQMIEETGGQEPEDEGHPTPR